MNQAYRNAFICGIVPLTVGTSAFILWLVLPNWFMMAVMALLGGPTLICGIIMFLVGGFELFCAWRQALKDPSIPRSRLRRRILTCAGLLLVNFPVAGAIFQFVSMSELRFTIEVRNDFSQPIENVLVFGGGIEASYGTLHPGESALRSFRIRRDGILEFKAHSQSACHEEIIKGYVTHGDGGLMTLTVHSDGTIAINERDPWILFKWIPYYYFFK